MKNPILRIARPTDNLAKVAAQYESGLGLKRLGGFEGHNGVDGVMLGDPDLAWHLEFTSTAGHSAGRAPTEDNLLVFYIADAASLAATNSRMTQAGFLLVPSLNPYWDEAGTTYEDVDGYRVVLVHGTWPMS